MFYFIRHYNGRVFILTLKICCLIQQMYNTPGRYSRLVIVMKPCWMKNQTQKHIFLTIIKTQLKEINRSAFPKDEPPHGIGRNNPYYEKKLKSSVARLWIVQTILQLCTAYRPVGRVLPVFPQLSARSGAVAALSPA